MREPSRRGQQLRNPKISFKAIVRTYIAKPRRRKNCELDWFRQQPSVRSAIENAALAINSKGKRFKHQRRLRKKSLESARRILLNNSNAIEQSKNFDDLFTLIDVRLQSVNGIGELYVYDTALRLGAKLNLLPTKVYIHAGTRKGAKALRLDGKKTTLDVSEMPADFQSLEAYEIEDVLCIFKDDLRKSNINLRKGETGEHSWCA